MRLAWMLWPALATCAALACAPHDEDASSDSVEAPSALEGAQRNEFFHLSEGSEFFPYHALRALEITQPDGRRLRALSRENLTRYGLIPDAPSDLNPDGLPIGITIARAPETRLVSLGVNCAACHVGQIDYRAGDGVHTRVLEGVPNMFDVKRFYDDVAKELETRWYDPLSKDTVEFAARATKELAEVTVRYHDVEDNDFEWHMSLEDRFKVIWQLVASTRRLATGADAPEAVIERLSLPTARKRLLLSRALFFRVVLNDPGGTPGGFGRADAFGTLKNRLFPSEGAPAVSSAPTSAPSLFHIADRAWFHANANTNSVLERNILQSLGLGAVADTIGPEATYVSSVNLRNVHALEQDAYRIRPPAWPAEVPLDAALAARGRDVYAHECASCHEPTRTPEGLYTSKDVPLAVVGTDDAHAVNFQGAVNGQTFVSRNGPMTEAIAKAYFERNAISPRDRAVWSGVHDAALNPEGRRSAPQWKADSVYMARPLDGVWATAPYLHNGSVPTLADLLEPAATRPKKFYLGQRLYDLEKVGHVVIDEAHGPDTRLNATFLFDTTLPGNANAGHEFGTTLSRDDKRALLEFLKGFGAGAEHPVRLGP